MEAMDMNLQPKPRNGSLIAGIILFFVFGGQLLTMFIERDDIWWTPEAMLVSLNDSTDQVDVFVKNERLVDLLDGHKLWIEAGDDLVAVTKEDIGFRLNNWDRLRASKITSFSICSALFLAGIMLFIYGAIPLIRKKNVDNG
jgi:hypothetical protein